MKTETRRFIAVVSMLCVLASCAQTGPLERQNTDMSEAAQSTSTFADHDSIVKRSENTAKEMVWHQKVLKAIIPLPRCTVRSETALNKS
jgi:predicted small lipoprotein YifL